MSVMVLLTRIIIILYTILFLVGARNCRGPLVFYLILPNGHYAALTLMRFMIIDTCEIIDFISGNKIKK